jgi:hypothetical protein
MSVDDTTKRVLRTTGKYLAGKGGERLAAQVGEQAVRTAMQSAYRATLAQQIARGAHNPGLLAMVSAATKGAGTRAAVQKAVPVFGRAAGVVAAPVIEVGLMYFDDEEHTGKDYAKAAGQAAASGAAGLAASVVAGAAAGSVVPGVGTVIGAAAGALTSLYVGRRLKEI